MIRILIIEDEQSAIDHLQQSLNKQADVELVAVLRSLNEARNFFWSNMNFDLIISDVQLADGYSFDVFQELHIQTPIIYVTSFNSYIMHALENNAIDYILKPFTPGSINKAIDKFRRLKVLFTPGIQIERLIRHANNNRQRLLVKKGKENVILMVDDVAIFYRKEKLLFAYTGDGQKYMMDGVLSDLFEALDHQQFFRINRQMIINLKYMKSFKTLSRVKLIISMAVDFPEPIIVSQDRTSSFKKWLAGQSHVYA